MEENKMDAHWSEIITITESMLNAAKNAQWDPLINMEAIRQELLKVFFGKEIQVDKLEVVKQGIHFIINTDKEISELVKSQSIQIKDEMSKLKNNRSAISQYNQISG